ncbi:threonyl-tRNA synthetase [Castilleja foliolosa]|uniref:Threonyl-tRNA synthetase n=1 Tax=Castilleja foliolosa TaxID=1961234 RepID=A0ABD3DNU2_9LAMI
MVSKKNYIYTIDGNCFAKCLETSETVAYMELSGAAYISGALFFDLDGISDRTTNARSFEYNGRTFFKAFEYKDCIIVYDEMGILSTAHVWWIWVLDYQYGALRALILNQVRQVIISRKLGIM